MQVVGVISDTHSLLRPEAIKALQGCDLILHAGDIGSLEVVSELQKIAPVIAVRGNIDKGPWAQAFPATEAIEVSGKFVLLIHNIDELDIEPEGHFDVVVFGHSHQAHNETKNGVLYFNPAGAGPRRFSLPIAVGKLTFNDGKVFGEIEELKV